MKSCDFKTTEASTKAWFRTKGLIDRYLNILDLGKFRVANREMSELSFDKYGIEGKLFLEENEKKAIPNTQLFQQIDRKKGIKYPNNEWVDEQSKICINF
jgi:hypothetical protein